MRRDDRTRTARVARRAVGGLLAACAAACGGGDAREGRATASAPVPPAPAPAPPVPARVVLDGGGLRFPDSTSGATRLVAFGVPASEIVAAMAPVAGAPRARGTNEDCGAGPLDWMSFAGGLDVTLQDGRFVGWSVRPADGQALRTTRGIGLRSTRAALDSAYHATVEETTLGIEFMAEELDGMLESFAPTARITDLWAGSTCIVR